MRKRHSISEALREDVGYTPERANEILDKAEEDLPKFKENADRIMNIAEGVTIGDLLEPGAADKAQKLIKAHAAIDGKVDKFQQVIEDIKESFDDDRAIYNRARDLDGKYWDLGLYLDVVSAIVEKIESFASDSEEYAKNLKRYRK